MKIQKVKRHLINHNTEYSKLFIVLGFLSAMSGSLLAPLLWKAAYYHLMQLAFIWYLFAFSLSIVKAVKPYSKGWKTFVLIVFLCACSTLWDEMFYDATKLEINDLIRFLSITIFSITYYYKHVCRIF